MTHLMLYFQNPLNLFHASIQLLKPPTKATLERLPPQKTNTTKKMKLTPPMGRAAGGATPLRCSQDCRLQAPWPPAASSPLSGPATSSVCWLVSSACSLPSSRPRSSSCTVRLGAGNPGRPRYCGATQSSHRCLYASL